MNGSCRPELIVAGLGTAYRAMARIVSIWSSGLITNSSMSSSKQSGDVAAEEGGVTFLHSSQSQRRVGDFERAEEKTGSCATEDAVERDMRETSVPASEKPLELLELVEDGECAVVC